MYQADPLKKTLSAGKWPIGIAKYLLWRRCLKLMLAIVRMQWNSAVLSRHVDVGAVVHAWNYRRYVLATIPVRRSEASELAYTKRKIEANFSNFSAWHQRSKVLTALCEGNNMDDRKSKEEGMIAQ
jgi:hypothetical protein